MMVPFVAECRVSRAAYCAFGVFKDINSYRLIVVPYNNDLVDGNGVAGVRKLARNVGINPGSFGSFEIPERREVQRMEGSAKSKLGDFGVTFLRRFFLNIVADPSDARRKVWLLFSWLDRLRRCLQSNLSRASGDNKPRRDDDAALPPLVFLPVGNFVAGTASNDDVDPWPQDRPLVSVVIPAFNYGRFVSEAVDSVLAQTFGNFEIIVVEGGSTDPESARLTMALIRPRTVVLGRDGPRLTGDNRNFGIAHARGKYVCCLDADDMLAPTYLEKAVFHLETGRFDIVCSSLRSFGATEVIVANPPRPRANAFRDFNGTFTSAVFRHRHWREAGGYRDTDPKVTGYLPEDWLFWAHLTAKGARVLNMPEPLFFYRRHAATMKSRVLWHSHGTLQTLICQALDRIVNQRKFELARARPVRPFPYVPKDGRLGALLAPSRDANLAGIIEQAAGVGWRVIAVLDFDDGPTGDNLDQRVKAAGATAYRLPRFVEPGLWLDFVRFLMGGHATKAVFAAPGTFVEQAQPYLKNEFSDVVFAIINESLEPVQVEGLLRECNSNRKLGTAQLEPEPRRIEAEVRRFRAADLTHRIGELDNLDGWVSRGQAGFMTYGPYLDLPPGNYVVCVALRLLAPLKNGDRVAVDVVDRGAARKLAESVFTCNELPVGVEHETRFAVSCPDGAFGLEVRIELFGEPSIGHGDVVVTQAVLLSAH